MSVRESLHSEPRTRSTAELAQLILYHLGSVAQGQKPTVTVEIIDAEPDLAIQDILAGILMLQEEVELRRAQVQESLVNLQEKKQELEAANLALAESSRRLSALSRQAGMAEVATGVLHNIGNVLNGVTVAIDVISERLKKWRPENIQKAARLLDEHRADLTAFAESDPRGSKLIPYLDSLGSHWQQEQSALFSEIADLRNHVRHIEVVVSKQQAYAKLSGVIERCSPTAIVDEACALVEASIPGQVETVREDHVSGEVYLDRHRVLQILVNLITNALQALVEAEQADKRLMVRTRINAQGQVEFQVQDNGIGIPPQNIDQIFAYGFTTKAGSGRGFGLHASALAAAEMKGTLTCTSDGPGRGTMMTLAVPVQSGPEGPMEKHT